MSTTPVQATPIESDVVDGITYVPFSYTFHFIFNIINIQRRGANE
jgi:hypothetical protein